MKAIDLLQSAESLHERTPADMRQGRAQELERAISDVTASVQRIIQSHRSDVKFAAIMQDAFVSLLSHAARCYALLDEHLEAQEYPDDTQVGLMVYTISVSISIVLDLLLQTLSAYVELAGALDGSIPNPQRTTALIAAFRGLLRNDAFAVGAMYELEALLNNAPDLTLDA